MRILVAGGGSCGWSAASYPSLRNHEVAIADDLIRCEWSSEPGTQPPTEYASVADRRSMRYG